MPYRIRALLSRYRAELVITAGATLFSSLFSLLLTITTQPSFEEGTFLLLTLLSVTTILLAAVLFNQKRLHYRRFHQLNKIMSTFFAFDLYDNEYASRQDHFTLEKALLAQRASTKVLPQILHTILHDNPELKVLNVVVDSGTQMAALFPYFFDIDLHCGDLLETVQVNIHTNNLAGVDELHKASEYRYAHSAVGRQTIALKLIGGQQYKRYRATLGEPALEYLQRMWDTQDASNSALAGSPGAKGDAEVTLGVLTGNWFLGGGLDLDQITLCARNRSHYQFKESVATNSQYRLLLSPLGKLLPLSSVDELNEIAASGGQTEPYEAVKFDTERRDRTYLLTTTRPADSRSPLKRSSAALGRVAEQGGKNFVLAPDVPCFDPGPRLTRDDLIHMELPHRYIRENFERVFADRR